MGNSNNTHIKHGYANYHRNPREHQALLADRERIRPRGRSDQEVWLQDLLRHCREWRELCCQGWYQAQIPCQGSIQHHLHCEILVLMCFSKNLWVFRKTDEEASNHGWEGGNEGVNNEGPKDETRESECALLLGAESHLEHISVVHVSLNKHWHDTGEHATGNGSHSREGGNDGVVHEGSQALVLEEGNGSLGCGEERLIMDGYLNKSILVDVFE